MLLIPENVSPFSSSHDNCIKLSGCETEGYQFYLCIQLEEVTIYNICAFLIRDTHTGIYSPLSGVFITLHLDKHSYTLKAGKCLIIYHALRQIYDSFTDMIHTMQVYLVSGNTAIFYQHRCWKNISNYMSRNRTCSSLLNHFL